jgi:hypothetical protein
VTETFATAPVLGAGNQVNRKLALPLRAADFEQVGMRLCENLSAGGALAAGREVLLVGFAAEQGLRQSASSETLSDAGRSEKQVAVSQPSAGCGAAQHVDLRGVSAQAIPEDGRRFKHVSSGWSQES